MNRSLGRRIQSSSSLMSSLMSQATPLSSPFASPAVSPAKAFNSGFPSPPMGQDSSASAVGGDTKGQENAEPIHAGSNRNQVQSVTLNKEQLKAIELATKGYNLYIGGSAGTGKTQLLRALRHVLQNRLGLKVAMTATTGVAACNIAGRTTHRALSLSIGGDVTNRDELLAYDVVIIDEVSMLSQQVFETLDEQMRLRAGHSPLPFGGVQIILCGDFLQLQAPEGDDIMSSDLFRSNFVMCALTTIVRQRNEDFVAQLQQVRKGVMPAELLRRATQWQSMLLPAASQEAPKPPTVVALKTGLTLLLASPLEAEQFIPQTLFPALWKRFPDLRNARHRRLDEQKKAVLKAEKIKKLLSLANEVESTKSQPKVSESSPLSSLRVLSWNVNGLAQSTVSTESKLFEIFRLRPDIVALQETHALEEAVIARFETKGFYLASHCARQDGVKSKGGTAIWVAKYLRASALKVPKLPGGEVAAICVSSNGINGPQSGLSLASWYIAPRRDTSTPAVPPLDEYVEQLRALGISLIVGDPNARHALWCPSSSSANWDSSERGRQIFSATKSSPWVVENNGTATMTKSNTSPDVVLACRPVVAAFMVSTRTTFNDHRPILLSTTSLYALQDRVFAQSTLTTPQDKVEWPRVYYPPPLDLRDRKLSLTY